MSRIDTDVPEIIVEIEGGEYNVAPRTVEIMEKLADAEKANAGKPAYKLWLAELEILLGKEGCKKLFVSGKKENVDRIQMIYVGVARAFRYMDDATTAAIRERDAEAVATALAPLNEMLRNLRALDKGEGNILGGNIREIHRG